MLKRLYIATIFILMSLATYGQRHDTLYGVNQLVPFRFGLSAVHYMGLPVGDTCSSCYPWFPNLGRIGIVNGILFYHNGSSWITPAAGGSVSSVNGLSGTVLLTTTNIPEGSNLYFTDARVFADSTVMLAYVKNQVSQRMKYSDTGNMLSHYLQASVAAATYQAILGYTAENIANKATNFSTINNTLYPTTAAVNNLFNSSLAAYMPLADSNSLPLGYVTITWGNSHYYPSGSNPAGYLTTASISGKVNYTDTAAMLASYQAAILGRMKYTDTSGMLSPYLHKADSSFNGGYMPWYYANTHFLTSFAETDPLSFHRIDSNTVKNPVTLTYANAHYLQSYTETDPLSFHLIDSNTLKNAVTYSFYFNHLPTGLPPTGAAGGSLAGTYPNPTIATSAVTGSMLANSAVDFSGTKVTGNLQIGNFDGGFSAGAGTFWGGDGHWEVPGGTLYTAGRGMGLTGGNSFYVDSTRVVYANDSNVNKGYCSWYYANTHFGTGSGSVTSVSSGNLSPLFTTSVATSTTTPVISYSLTTQSANLVFAGPTSGGAAGPTFRTLVAADIPTLSYLTTISGITAGGDLTGTYANPTIKTSVSLTGSPTTTTQSAADNSTKIATTAYVDQYTPSYSTATTTTTVTPTVVITDRRNPIYIASTGLSTAVFVANVSGTLSDMQAIIWRPYDNGTSRAITWGTNYYAGDGTLPSTTITGHDIYIEFLHNSRSGKEDCVAGCNATKF